MPITCTANDLLPLAAVMRGMSEEQRNYVNTYLLALAAGVDPDPNEILAAAACFRCVPEQKLKEMSAWLLCTVAGGVTPPTPGDCGALSGAGDPTGVTTPEFSGQLYHRTAPDSYYRSTGLTSADWVAISGGSVQDMQVAWTPTNLKFGEWSAPLTLTFLDSGVTTISSTLEIVRASPYGVDIEDQLSLTSISLSALTSSLGLFYFKNLPALTSFSSPLLATVPNSDIFFTDVGLTSLSLPSLTTVYDLPHAASSGFDIEGPSLTTLSLPAYVPWNGAYFYTSAPLNAASVNHILARHVANAAYVSGDISMTDGGAAAPTGQGIIDKGTLIGRGVTVATN